MYGLPIKEWYHIEFKNIINNLNTVHSTLRKTVGLRVDFNRGLYKENLYNTLCSSRNDEEENIKNKTNFPNLPITLSLFPDFWELYPRHTSKGQALTAWKNLCTSQSKRKNKPTWQQIIIAIKKQKKSERWQDSNFIPMASTWLNQYRWLDDPKEMVSFNHENKNKFKPPYKEWEGRRYYLCSDGEYRNKAGSLFIE
jgi:hypothetical protein